ncbi:MAG: NAD(P)-dependent oxidoreductase [Paracoccaceae bacterium]
MTTRPLIFSTHPLHPEVTRDLQALGTLRIASAPAPDAILAESAGAGIIVVRAPIPAEVITREAGLMALIRHGAGLDMIPVAEATKAGVLVANVPGANAQTVAEHVIWSSMALLRQYPRVALDFRASGWQTARAHSDAGREISGKTLGIVGMGNIGRALAGMAIGGFGMKVIAHTRSTTGLPKGVEHAALDDMLSRADIVALCCPLTDQTRGMIGAGELARMKPDAILVNVSRGPVVDEGALLAALQIGKLAGAVLDVFRQSPLPTDHPFLSLPNVVLTPHMAGITEESMLRMGQGVVHEARRILSGAAPDNFVNPEALPAFQARFPEWGGGPPLRQN